jgi:hypothetical protein
VVFAVANTNPPSMLSAAVVVFLDVVKMQEEEKGRKRFLFGAVLDIIEWEMAL